MEIARSKYYLAAQLVAAQNAPYYTKTKQGAKQLIRFIEAASGYVSYVRLLPWFPTGEMVDYRKGSGKYAAFPWMPVKMKDKWTWDLDVYNEEYFSSLDNLIYVLTRAGFKIVFDLIDYCESFLQMFKRKSPLWNNKQGLKFGDKEMTDRIKDFAGRVLKILEYHAPYDFMIEIGNEIYAGEVGAEFVKEMVDWLVMRGIRLDRIIVPTAVLGGDYLHNIAKAARQKKNGIIPLKYSTLVPSVHLASFSGTKAEEISASREMRWLLSSFSSVWLSTDGVGSIHNIEKDIDVQVTALNKMIDLVHPYKARVFLEIQAGAYWWTGEDEFGYERPHYRLRYLPVGYFKDITERLKVDVEKRLGDVTGATIVLNRLVALHTPKGWKEILKNIFRKLWSWFK